MARGRRRSGAALAALAVALAAPSVHAGLAPGAPSAAAAAATGAPWPPLDYTTGQLSDSAIVANTAGGCDFIEGAPRTPRPAWTWRDQM